MSRAKKLLIVSLVLALGLGLAWPFRNSAAKFVPTQPRKTPVLPISEAVTHRPSPAPTVAPSAPTLPTVPRQVPATMTSSTEEAIVDPSEVGFDVESHPALAQEQRGESSEPTTPTNRPADATREARPAYATARSTMADDAAWPEEVIHVVRNGDTLEKLAQRYLGDAGRALELFDLNREQLTNPHLLPIGAELRIPVPPQRDVD